VNGFLIESVLLLHSPQYQLRVDLARALIKRERDQKIASVTVGMRAGIREDTMPN
jgi:hypothetical protein